MEQAFERTAQIRLPKCAFGHLARRQRFCKCSRESVLHARPFCPNALSGIGPQSGA